MALLLIAALLPVHGLFAFWADASGDGAPDAWVDPSSGEVFTLEDLNAISWDIDGDGLSNASELALGTNPFLADTDGDGLSDAIDPAPLDVYNDSPYNGLAWVGDALMDNDGDGIANFYDAYPNDYFNGNYNPDPDSDGDGFPDSVDPAPSDSSNYSQLNGTCWYGDALNDADGDGTPNFYDTYPYDSTNGSGGYSGDPDSDGDGFPDSTDPAPGDSSNYSQLNWTYWYSDALGDSDNDGIANFHDTYPYDYYNGNPPVQPGADADGDGIPDSSDPAPSDSSNYSTTNWSAWGADAFGDADGDGVLNFYDAYPYDPYNGNPPDPGPGDNPPPENPNPDTDGDGIPDSSDPSPWDYSNNSAANGINWYGDALGDADGDGIANFYDQWPNDSTNGRITWAPSDSDDDGIVDPEDPAPGDPSNTSPINGVAWYSSALADADGDGNPNFTDPWPYDPYNGNPPPPDNPDTDGDGIPDVFDPAPGDSSNTSPVNWMSWYGDALGDADGDGTLNYYDSYPYDYYNGGTPPDPNYNPNPDTDGDGFSDANDPAPNDPANYSSYNSVSWYGDALGDNDGDGTQNFFDSYPYDPYNGSPPPDSNPNPDSDGDGIYDSTDPAPGDSINTSPINGVAWYGDIWCDADGDGVANFWDPMPYGEPQVDSDNDGLLDNIDPSPFDSSNYSPFNNTSWQSDALGDADGDGIANFFDEWPYDRFNGTDDDGDGIPNSSDPAPQDYSNLGPHNGRYWYGDALGDIDNDGIFNFFDVYPEDPYNGNPPVFDNGGGNGGGGSGNGNGNGNGDGNGGGGQTPKILSPYNDLEWGDDAWDDFDGDGTLNFYDPFPYEGISHNHYIYTPPFIGMPALVILNNDYDEIGEPPAEGVTPAADLADESLVIKGGPMDGKLTTQGLMPLGLSMHDEYVEAGGSVTITQIGGTGAVRIHAVRMEGGIGVEEQAIPLGQSFRPSLSGSWDYWVEGVVVGQVTLRYEFPRQAYGVDAEHPDGAMEQDISGEVQVLVCEASLSVDLNRNGKITTGIPDRMAGTARPFRYWINIDEDDVEAGPSGDADVDGVEGLRPVSGGRSGGTTVRYTRANALADDKVNGSRDLVDFFPVFINVGQLVTAFPPETGVKYRLKHAGGALNFAYTDLDPESAGKYHREILPSGFGPDFDKPAKSAPTLQITAAGVELSGNFLNATKDGKGVIIVEGREQTDRPLVLEVSKSGVVLAELSLALSLGPVEEMYRHLNLTGLAKTYDGAPVSSPKTPMGTNMNPPTGLPDKEMSNKYFVFVHGYHIDAQQARGWNAEVFKRLYALGSRARFVGVTWNGDTKIDYHTAVFQAFQAGEGLRAALAVPAGADVTVAAHSLGNILVSHAIQSGGFTPTRYYMINAAAPLEAYDPSVLEQKGPGSAYAAMTESDWKGKDDRMFASNWYKLFDADNDSRGKLTWNGAFNKVALRPGVVNFYSPSEDVVQNPKSSSSLIILDMLKNFDTERGAWGHQEMIKGGAGLGGFAFERVQGGWRRWDSREVDATTSDEELRTTPRFLPFWEGDLFSEDEGAGSIKAAEPRVLYDLLARGLPALSYAAAANPVPAFEQSGGDFDMATQGRDPSVWPTDGHEYDRLGQWNHSDFKNVALPYVYKMYKAMIDKGSLRDSP